MEEEQVPVPLIGNAKTPTFLMVLLVLSGLNVSFGLFSQLLSIGDAPQEDLIEVVEEAFYNADMDMDEIPTWVMPEIMDFIEHIMQNFGLINAVDLAYYLILLPALFLMYRLKVMGYYIYVATQVAGVVFIPFLYGFNTISWLMVGTFSFTALLFIVLYTLNIKHLH